jgi:hypothetical protein
MLPECSLFQERKAKVRAAMLRFHTDKFHAAFFPLSNPHDWEAINAKAVQLSLCAIAQKKQLAE